LTCSIGYLVPVLACMLQQAHAASAVEHSWTFTGTKRIQLVQFGMQDRIFGPYWAAMARILIPESVATVNSGKDGFLSEKQATRPLPCRRKSKLP
jgi:hypothetical protein